MHIVTQFIAQVTQHIVIGSKHSTGHTTIVRVPRNTSLDDQYFSECFNHPTRLFRTVHHVLIEPYVLVFTSDVHL